MSVYEGCDVTLGLLHPDVHVHLKELNILMEWVLMGSSKSCCLD